MELRLYISIKILEPNSSLAIHITGSHQLPSVTATTLDEKLIMATVQVDGSERTTTKFTINLKITKKEITRQDVFPDVMQQEFTAPPMKYSCQNSNLKLIKLLDLTTTLQEISKIEELIITTGMQPTKPKMWKILNDK